MRIEFDIFVVIKNTNVLLTDIIMSNKINISSNVLTLPASAGSCKQSPKHIPHNTKIDIPTNAL